MSQDTPQGKDFLAQLDNALERPRQIFMGNRLLKHVLQGTLTLDLYKALLKETYHFVRHTPDHLKIAAGRMEDRALAERFLSHAGEEVGHDLWALEDLEALGEDSEAVKASDPLPHTMALITYQNYTVNHLNPKAILGLEYGMEGLTAKAGPAIMGQLKSLLGIDDDALRFLGRHAALDAKHAVDDIAVIREFVRTDEERAAIIRNGSDSMILYASVYDGLCANLGM